MCVVTRPTPYTTWTRALTSVFKKGHDWPRVERSPRILDDFYTDCTKVQVKHPGDLDGLTGTFLRNITGVARDVGMGGRISSLEIGILLRATESSSISVKRLVNLIQFSCAVYRDVICGRYFLGNHGSGRCLFALRSQCHEI